LESWCKSQPTEKLQKSREQNDLVREEETGIRDERIERSTKIIQIKEDHKEKITKIIS